MGCCSQVCVCDTWIQEKASDNGVMKLNLVNEVLDFHVFPFTSHTATNISKWLTEVLLMHEIPVTAISGVTPDGASDAQGGCKGVPGLASKVDKCHLHDLMRCVLYAIGLAGPRAACPNEAARDLVNTNKRFVQLSHQSRDVERSATVCAKHKPPLKFHHINTWLLCEATKRAG